MGRIEETGCHAGPCASVPLRMALELRRVCLVRATIAQSSMPGCRREKRDSSRYQAFEIMGISVSKLQRKQAGKS